MAGEGFGPLMDPGMYFREYVWSHQRGLTCCFQKGCSRPPAPPIPLGGVGPWGPYEVTHKRAKGQQSALLGLPGPGPQGRDLF